MALKFFFAVKMNGLMSCVVVSMLNPICYEMNGWKKIDWKMIFLFWKMFYVLS
jgi:hypothetical protein